MGETEHAPGQAGGVVEVRLVGRLADGKGVEAEPDALVVEGIYLARLAVVQQADALGSLVVELLVLVVDLQFERVTGLL